jgi:hypothetical protein
LEEVCEIYELAGRPVAQKHRQLAVQLMLSMEVAERDRLPKRLPDYLKWATLYLWSDPQHTKSLLNVLRDGDWDVDLTMRKVPVPRKPSVMEEQKRIFLESQR